MPEPVHRFRPPHGDNYQYLALAGDRCLIVDPFDDRAVLREVEALGARPAGVLITHTHWDHTNGLAGVLRAHPVPVYAHPAAREDLPKDADVHAVAEDDEIPFGDGAVTVMETLGHHPAHVTYRWAGLLFVGDVLFLCGCGNPNFGGNVDVLFATVWERLRDLPGELQLAWGHDYAEKNLRFAREVEPTNPALRELADEIAAATAAGGGVPWRTLAAERDTNPFLRCDVAAVIESAVAHGAEGRDPQAVFRALRAWRDRY